MKRALPVDAIVLSPPAAAAAKKPSITPPSFKLLRYNDPCLPYAAYQFLSLFNLPIFAPVAEIALSVVLSLDECFTPRGSLDDILSPTPGRDRKRGVGVRLYNDPEREVAWKLAQPDGDHRCRQYERVSASRLFPDVNPTNHRKLARIRKKLGLRYCIVSLVSLSCVLEWMSACKDAFLRVTLKHLRTATIHPEEEEEEGKVEIVGEWWKEEKKLQTLSGWQLGLICDWTMAQPRLEYGGEFKGWEYHTDGEGEPSSRVMPQGTCGAVTDQLRQLGDECLQELVEDLFAELDSPPPPPPPSTPTVNLLSCRRSLH